MARPYYESGRAVAEYLFLHYGGGRQPGFPQRCVSECLDVRRLPAKARALDLGCAVGGASFELARHCAEVVGVDYSRRFIAAASALREKGFLCYQSVEEGGLTRPRRAVVPKEIDRRRVRFERGDAMALRSGAGVFDVVLMANLIDRLPNPRKCLEQISRLVKPGGQLVVTSPWTWLAEYTPRRFWLGGFSRQGRPVKSFDTLRAILTPRFRLARRRDLPMLIREHVRKFQFIMVDASVWVKRKT